jgi:hypothetical protein
MFNDVIFMANSFLNNFHTNQFWKKENVIKYSVVWAIISVLTYVIFSGPMSGVDRPSWYRFLTAYPLQMVPVFVSSLLCLHNGLNKETKDKKRPWIIIGIALMCFFVGNLFFSSWELLWHLNSTGCLGDPFFVAFYVLLLAAILMVIWQRKIRPNRWQLLVIAMIAAYSIILANVILEPVALKPVTPVAVTATTESTETKPPEPAFAPDVPGWVQLADRTIKPYGKSLNVFYVWCDVCLFCLSVAIIFDCWGSRLARSWQFTAQAVFFIYIADAWYAYAGNRIADYQAGFMIEVCWILGMLQFGIAAAIEFEQSISLHAAKIAMAAKEHPEKATAR